MLDDDREQPRTLLITLTGKDRPGVTSMVFDTLAKFSVEVIDIEQIVLRRRLILGLLVSSPRDWKPLREAMEQVAADLGMSLDLDRGSGDNRRRPEGRSHVTVLGTPLRSPAVAAIAGRIADTGANIDRIERMARYPITAIDLHVSGVDPEKLRDILAREAAIQGVDIAVQAANLLRRGMRLIVMDVDSTLIQGEVIEMLAAHAGCEAEVARVTEQAMRGEIDFGQSLRDRVALLEGLDASALDKVYDDLVLAPGARTTVRVLKRLGYRFAMVSGGFSQLTDRLAEELGVDFSVANELEIVDGKLTGRVVGPVIDRAGQGRGPADLRRAERGERARHHRHRRRRERPRHAQRRRARHRLQRQAGGPGGRARVGQRALHGRDPLPARDQPRGGRRRRRRGRHHHPRAVGLTGHPPG